MKDFNISFSSHHRKDLTLDIRLAIAFTALLDNSWGIITKLAKQYAISRTFVYMLQYQLNNAIEGQFYSPTLKKNQSVTDSYNMAEASILRLKLIGKCSIPAISQLLKINGQDKSSVGSVWNTLDEFGRCLPNVLPCNSAKPIYIHIACDEIFSHHQPILISVEPISSAIIKIELSESRKTQDWIEHLEDIEKEGHRIIKVVSDQAKGICNGAGFVVKNNHQPDTFHAVSKKLGKWVDILQRSAYACIEDEYRILDTLDSAKSEKIIDSRLAAHDKAMQDSLDAIEISLLFNFLYHCIIEQLRIFNNKGNVRERNYAEETIKIALDFLSGMQLPVKLKTEIDKILNNLPKLLDYLDVAKQVVWKLKNNFGFEQYVVDFFCLAWQYQKNFDKAKKPVRKNYYQQKNADLLLLLSEILDTDFEKTKNIIFDQLDTIIQSSSMVETINSIIRTFLNTSKNHINQNQLNLIMFYHNHRRYMAGKRKGKTPMEILTSVKQEKDWLELLICHRAQAVINSKAA